VTRWLAITMMLLALTSCGREVPLRIGPASVEPTFALLEVRVWRSAECPLSAADAASVDNFGDVAVVRYYTSLASATSVGVVPSGAHAVSVLARDGTCVARAYGCTPRVDFASAASVDVVWATVAPSFACSAGYQCGAGSCFEPRLDAGR